jgi:hypothetical protein
MSPLAGKSLEVGFTPRGTRPPTFRPFGLRRGNPSAGEAASPTRSAAAEGADGSSQRRQALPVLRLPPSVLRRRSPDRDPFRSETAHEEVR